MHTNIFNSVAGWQLASRHCLYREGKVIWRFSNIQYTAFSNRYRQLPHASY